jgi:hypothetical protein
MELVTHKKFKGDRLMPWRKRTVVTAVKGLRSKRMTLPPRRLQLDRRLDHARRTSPGRTKW